MEREGDNGKKIRKWRERENGKRIKNGEKIKKWRKIERE